MTNWGRKKIAEISSVFEDGDWIESKDQSTEGVRLIQTGNVGNGIFKDRGEKARYISEDTFKKLRCTEIFEGDCLVSRLPDPVGRACIIPYTGEKMITAVDCTIIRFDKKQIIPNWFLYYTLSHEYKNEIEKQVTGATRQRISRKNLGLVSIPVAPLPEQQRLVALLDRCFAAIDRAKVLAEQNLQNARALFESYLQSVFEEAAIHSQLIRIGDMCKLTRGHNPPKSQFIYEPREGYVRFYQIRDGGSDDYAVYVPDSSKLHKVKENELLMVAYRHVGRVYRGVSGAFNVALCKISNRDESKLDSDYLYNIIPTSFVRGELLKKSERSLIPSMSVEHLKEIEIPLPPINDQQTIVRQLDALRAETQKLEAVYQKKIADLEELKKSVLEKAFRGELVGEINLED